MATLLARQLRNDRIADAHAGPIRHPPHLARRSQGGVRWQRRRSICLRSGAAHADAIDLYRRREYASLVSRQLASVILIRLRPDLDPGRWRRRTAYHFERRPSVPLLVHA